MMHLFPSPDFQLSFSDTGPFVFPSELENLPEARIPVEVADQSSFDYVDGGAVPCKLGNHIVIIYPDTYIPALGLNKDLINLTYRNRPFIRKLVIDRVRVINDKFRQLAAAFSFVSFDDRRALFITIRAIETYKADWKSHLLSTGFGVHAKSCEQYPLTVNSDNPFQRIFIDLKTSEKEEITFLSTRVSAEYLTCRLMKRIKPRKDISPMNLVRWQNLLSVYSSIMVLKNAGKAPLGLEIPEAIFSYTKVMPNEYLALPKVRIYCERRMPLITLLNTQTLTDNLRDRIAFQICSAVHFLHTEFKIAHNNIDPESIEVDPFSMRAYLVGYESVTSVTPFFSIGEDLNFGSHPNSPIEEIELIHPRGSPDEFIIPFPLRHFWVVPISRDQWQLGLTLLILGDNWSVHLWNALINHKYQEFYQVYDAYMKWPACNKISKIGQRLLVRNPHNRLPIPEIFEYLTNGEPTVDGSVRTGII